MTDREAFEAWASESGYQRSGTSNDFDYPLGRVLWRAWQAATAAERERCAQAVLNLDRENWFLGQRGFAVACTTAIRKGQ